MLDALDDERAFVSVRHLVNVEPDPDWVVRPAVLDGLKVLAARGLTFDYVAILPRHLEHVAVLAQGIPDLRIVIDHLGSRQLSGADSSLGAHCWRAPRACRMSSPKSRDSMPARVTAGRRTLLLMFTTRSSCSDQIASCSEATGRRPFCGAVTPRCGTRPKSRLEGFHGTSESGFWAEPAFDFYRLRVTDRP